MRDPIQLHQELQQLYRKFLDTGLPLRNRSLARERRDLFEQPGTICQEPIIELVPTYPSAATLDEAATEGIISEDFAAFAQIGLFPPANGEALTMYTHQYESLKAAHLSAKRREEDERAKHLLITTGTGSGKTESFLMPLLADILAESESWDVRGKTPAVRGLLLYPLNALAEDQVVRLRKTLNQVAAVEWLDEHRAGERITFGRYTGATLKKQNGSVQKLLPKQSLAYSKALRQYEASGKGNATDREDAYLYNTAAVDAPQTAELWHRTQMQDAPPDLLITNFAMLSIMLMRDEEQTIFEQTREWLAADRERHLFHLVVDELHSYRGTPGTETAYTIRLLLRRLGLAPNSPQLRILASSASMSDSEATWRYVGGFFGLSPKQAKHQFALVTDPASDQRDSQFGKVRLSLKQVLAKAVNAADNTYDPSRTATEETAERASSYLKALKQVIQRLDHPPTLSELAYQLFGEDGTADERAHGTQVIIATIGQARKPNGDAEAKIRTHLFFRSIDHLYACSNPKCNQVPTENGFETAERGIGKLFRTPNNRCACGGKILELNLCRYCGESFLRGLRRERPGNDFEIYLERSRLDEKELPILMVPGRITEGNDQNANPKPPEGWHWGKYNSKTGDLKGDVKGRVDVTFYRLATEDVGNKPSQCPCCEVKRQKFSPIAPHRIGNQRVSQVLADGLFRELRNQRSAKDKAKDKKPKLIVFSDSRQGAAKLSAGIELNHYRDTLRQKVLQALAKQDEDVKRVRGLSDLDRKLDREEQQFLNSLYERSSGPLREAIDAVRYGDEHAVQLLDSLNHAAPTSIADFQEKVEAEILALGSNPAGPKPSIVNKDQPWYTCYDWTLPYPGKINGSSEGETRQNIAASFEFELLTVLFAHNQMSLESLKRGHARIVPTTTQGLSPRRVEYLNSIIRILGENFRMVGMDQKWNVDGFPKRLTDYTSSVYASEDLFRGWPSAGGLSREATKHWLLDAKLVLSESQVLITGKNLEVIPARIGDTYYTCERCDAVHLHASAGVCTNCYHSKSLQPKTLTQDDLDDKSNYYLYLAGQESFRLHAEELSGQTDSADKQARQAAFQGIYEDIDYQRPTEIDLLSVTTTMEAGVDIGGLSAVMMGNVPPQRFNYQQRVGRAGRFGQALSVALTVARHNSHDQVHYVAPQRMVAGDPPAPYLDLRRAEIARRLINKEVLYTAFRECEISQSSGNTHGGFGDAADWDAKREQIVTWLSNSEATCTEIARDLLQGTSEELDPATIAAEVRQQLIANVNLVVDRSDRYPQRSLGERMASAGYFPMFGFPTRSRTFYTKRPKGRKGADQSITRNLDMAIAAFAPGTTQIKDKKIYKSRGLVGYKPSGGKEAWAYVDGRGEVHEHIKRCTDTESCGAITEDSQDKLRDCPVCGKELETVRACSPIGFYADLKAEDYKGQFEYTETHVQTALDPSSELKESRDLPSSNLRLSSNSVPHSGIVHVLNDNNGEYYFLKASTFETNEGDTVEGHKWQVVSAREEGAIPYALLATRHTGVLTVGLNELPNHISLDASARATQIAFLSYAYLLRRSLCADLDIESHELTAGYRRVPQRNEALSEPQAYFSETLDNGAGYCNYLNSPDGQAVTLAAFVTALAPGGEQYKHLLSDYHESSCDRSCYDCLREYDNQREHGELFWRLGLDVALLGAGDADACQLTAPHWAKLMDKLAAGIAARGGGRVKHHANSRTPYVLSGEAEPIQVFVHPLWSDEFREAYMADLRTEVGGALVEVSVLDALVASAV